MLGLALLALGGLHGPLGTDGAAAQGSADAAARPVLATRLAEPITPVIADHLADGIERAEDEGHGLYLVELDTPGGLDSAMRDIVQSILAAEVPVAVYVSPAGGRAASAGAVITLSAPVAAMTPGTTIGSATPVTAEGEEVNDKVVEDAAAYSEELARLRGRNTAFAVDMVREGISSTAQEAVDEGVVDVLADSRADLLDRIDGTSVTVADEQVTLRTAGSEVDEQDLGVARRILQWLSDPNLALILLSIGTLGIVYELASPGIGAGGFVGVAALVTGLFALSVLPVSIVGLLFLLVAAGLFVGELFAPGVGILAGLGSASLVLAGLFLLAEDDPSVQVSLLTVVPTAAVMFGAVLLAGRLALRARAAPTADEEKLAGERATVRRTGDTPQVFVEGAWWRARTDPDRPLSEGDEVRVLRRDGLDLVVEPADRTAADASAASNAARDLHVEDRNGRTTP